MTATVYTIKAEDDFLKSLATHLWNEKQNSPNGELRFSEALILLPTHRACQHLRMAFTQFGKATLLPRMVPIGDEEGGDPALFGQSWNHIPPAMAPLRRQMLLTRLVMRADQSLSWEQAADYARALGQFLDTVAIERADMARLGTLVDETELAAHWQKTVDFLSILTHAWPKVLEEEGAIDAAKRRDLILSEQAAHWHNNPPAFPVIAAGSTGTHKATADLLKTIAHMPQGLVILPGFDRDIDEETWQAIDDNHPQSSMKKLVEHIGIKRHDVQPWPICSAASYQKTLLMREVMRPDKVADRWQSLNKKNILKSDCVTGLHRLDLHIPQVEATTIALILRETLETPDKTAMLVTPDRDLAMRVTAILRRWDCTANDSGGVPLITQSAPGFLNHILSASAPHAGAVAMLSLLKHPLAACGNDPAHCRAEARETEIAVYRTEDKTPNTPLLDSATNIMRPLKDAWNEKRPLSFWIETHSAVATAMATTDKEGGHQRLWQGEAGEDIATWLNNWKIASRDCPPMCGDDYASLFHSMVGRETFRPSHGQHQRIFILGPIEARLIRADVTILGGMNEGVWPADVPVDPWMSRPMKDRFGLPPPERLIGLSAHDFSQLASAPLVYITRAKRRGTSPTVPSRFLLQLDVVLSALGLDGSVLAPQIPFVEWAAALDKPAAIVQITPPAPCPPVSLRPQKLSVTKIRTWMRNPYAIYAEFILRLKKLTPLDDALCARDRGILLHAVMEEFFRNHAEVWPQDAFDQLLKYGRKYFLEISDNPEVLAFWWPRFKRAAAMLIKFENVRREAGIYPIKDGVEASGTTKLGNFTLYGRVDRIDQMADGTVSIVDYKSGSVPSKKSVVMGEEPQLSLLALIAEEGGFEKIGKKITSNLLYIGINGTRTADAPVQINGDIETLIAQAKGGLRTLVDAYANPLMPYLATPRPDFGLAYDDYDHLARRAEWSKDGDSAEGDAA